MRRDRALGSLARDLPATSAAYALLDCAASAGFDQNDEIHTRLNRDDVEKHCLFTGQNSWLLGHAAPCLVPLDNQPGLRDWILDTCLERGWAVLLASPADTDAIVAHLKSLFALRAENNRKVYFRFYDPRILEEFLPLLDLQETMAFMGPVLRFLFADAGGRPLTFDKPQGRLTAEIDPAAVIMAKRNGFSDQWNQRLLEQHVRTYTKSGFQAAANPAEKSVTLTDKAGTSLKLQKTATGASVTTGEKRLFDYRLSACKHPAQVVDPAGHAIDFDIQQRTNQDDPQPGENLLHAIRMDHNRHSWIFEYDERDHLRRMDFPDGTCAEMQHDGYGNLCALTDRNGHETRFARDFDQRLTAITDANGGRTEFSYDGLSAPGAITFADGTCFNFEYTDAGVLENFLANNSRVAGYQVNRDSGSWSISYADGTSAEFVVQNDRIVRAVNEAGAVDLAYDENGLLVSESFAGRLITYHRDAAGQLTGLTSPLGGRLCYKRDQENRVSAIEAWNGQTIRVNYAPSGAFESIVYPNGTRLNQTTTALGLPDRLRLSTAGGEETIFDRCYQRDPLGRVTRISNGEDHIAYEYDKQGRLLGTQSSIAGLNEVFTLDAKANRLTDKHTRYQLNAADRITQAGAHDFAYDNLGNLTVGTCPRGPAAFGYCSLNRLESARHAQGRARYVYDAFGRRVEKITGRERTRFIWAGNQLLHEIQLRSDALPTDAPDTAVFDYLFFPATPVLLALRRHDQNPLWVAFGHRYEVLSLTDAAGRPVWQAEYDAYGTAHIRHGHDIFQPLRLPGQYHDAETGLHYNQARYYHPRLGRYLSPDPLFLEGGSDNFYAYCNSDPINHIDPAGEFIFIPMLIGAVIGAAISGGLEAWRQHQTGGGTDGFAIAKAALLGGAIGAIGGGVGAVAEAAVAVGGTSAMAAGTLTGMGTAGFLSGTAGSVAEQCAESKFTGRGIDPLSVAKQALTDGVIGAAVGLISFGTGGFIAKKLRKAAGGFKPRLPAERPASLLAKARSKARSLTARVKSAAIRKNGRSNAFCVGDPVNPVTGEVVLEQTDFTLTGRIPLAWTRHYGSRSDYSGLLGPGWQCPADARLQIDADGMATFFDGSPAAAVFAALPDQQPVMEIANGAILEADELSYQVRLKSGLTYHFDRQFCDDRSLVTKISAPDGHHLRFIRQDDELIQLQDDSGQSIQIVCENGRIIRMVQRDKPLAAYHYRNGRLTAAIDPLDQARRFVYDNSRLVRHSDKNKLSFHYAYNGQGKCIHAWGDKGLYDYRLEYPPYEPCTRVTDSRGRVQTFIFDKDNLPLKIIDHDGATTEYAYDDVGRVIKVTDPIGRSSEYDYDAAGNVVKIIRPDEHMVQWAYDERHRPVQAMDPNGKIWEQQYDDKGRLLARTDPLGGRTEYRYNPSGDLQTMRDPEGRLTRLAWDQHGRLISATDPAGRTTRFERNPFGDITAIIDPSGARRRYVYDAKSRLCRVIHPNGHQQHFAWDPEDNLVLHTDENGHQTRFEYGGLNEIVKRINADGTCVSYQYDSEENLIGVTNEKGQTHRYTYDLAGRLIGQTDYYGHSSTYTYDPAGQMIQSIDPLKRIITYAYDPAGRLRTRTFENDERETFTWDAAGNLTSFQSPGAQVKRFFDAANNLVSETSGEFTVLYQYDQSGLRTRRATSCGNNIQYTYDPAGDVSAIQINLNEPVRIQRNTLGQITKEHFSNFLQRNYTYNAQGLLTDQTIDTASGRIQRRYQYDAAGRLIEKQDNRKGPWQFSYDPMGRITQALDPEHQLHDFNPDPTGDLLEHMPDIGIGPRCAKYKDTLYQYDAAGNLSERRNQADHIRFTWDELNRLTRARKADDTRIDMAYDALGRRHQKSVNGERTVFTWDGDALLTEQFDDQPAREYIYYPNTFEPLAIIDGDGQVYYYHNDPNGLPQELTDANGTIVWSAAYDPLGRVTKILTDRVAQPLRLQGQYFDEELALCYTRNRYFDPQICSFISQDPIGLAAGENIYAYAPNVWTWADPLGLACENASKNTVLNLGSGKNPMQGAVNVDIGANTGVNVVADANTLPFKSGSFTEAHSINPYGFNPVNAETARVLQPGATLKVTGTARNPFAQPLSASQARAAGFEVIETTPIQSVHQFGVQTTTTGGVLNTSTSTTTVYRRLP